MGKITKVRFTTLTKTYSFLDRDGLVAKALQKGMPIEEVVKKFKDRLVEKRIKKGNVLLNEGAHYLMLALTGAAPSPPFDNLNSHIGVGNGNDPASPEQTGLLGSSIAYKKVLEGYPVVENGSVTFATFFEPHEANFHWWEWTVANGRDNSAVNLNRAVEDLGVKTSDVSRIIVVVLALE